MGGYEPGLSVDRMECVFIFPDIRVCSDNQLSQHDNQRCNEHCHIFPTRRNSWLQDTRRSCQTTYHADWCVAYRRHRWEQYTTNERVRTDQGYRFETYCFPCQ